MLISRALLERVIIAEGRRIAYCNRHLQRWEHAFFTMGKFIKASGQIIATMSGALRAHWAIA